MRVTTAKTSLYTTCYNTKALLIPALLLLMQIVQAAAPHPVKQQKDRKHIYTVVDEPPEFPGGYAAMKQFIANNLLYPPEACESAVMGKVFLRIVITKKGKITDIEILRSLHPAFDREAIRVIKKMPRWKPGRHGGKPVNVYYTLPVTFGYNN